MASDEIEQSQSGVEEMGVGGPGAPTPLSALEVCPAGRPIIVMSNCTLGRRRTYKEGHSIDCGGWLQHR